MAACLEAKEMNEMRLRAEGIADSATALVCLPFRYFSCIIKSYRLFIETYLYFRAVSLKHLTECYKPGEDVCANCLNRIYELEQKTLIKALELTKYRFIGWGFQRIVDKIEDRSETLILGINKDAVNTINKLIDKAEKGGLKNSNWQEQVNAL